MSGKTAPNEEVSLKITIRDFGPIARGQVELRPLTLFVGPNNSGKSYAAMLLHAVFEACCPLGAGRPSPWVGNGPFPFLVWLDAQSLRFGEATRIRIPEAGEEVAVNPETVRRLSVGALKQVWGVGLSVEISRSLGCPLSELARIGKRTFSVGMESRKYAAEAVYDKKQQLRLAEHRTDAIDVRLRGSDPGRSAFTVEEKGAGTYVMSVPSSKASQPRAPSTELLAADLVYQLIASLVLKSTARPCYYLPAARSGILQAHRALAAGVVRRSSYIGAEPLEIPPFPGAVADFVSTLLTLPEDKKHFYPLAQRVENDLVGGEITVRRTERNLPGEIVYRFRGVDIPLHRSSSTVSEFAPLALYLKHVVEPGSVLIIEEPEAHLHPHNQRIMAKLLVELVRNGVYVAVTTHSDWLIQQLTSFLMLANVRPAARQAKFGYPRDLYLRPEDVGAYVFAYDGRSRAYKIRAIEVTDEGIPEDEFMRIHEALYDEMIQIERHAARRRAE